ncbi:TetR/AcrR family transcriptional regulator [Deinococcus misasensis]|uniref:TetR/AcrR family transcriptional regulator n=1 Tax=Deinococcus misasensis TaxID=392413 RepID=UPI00054ED0FA|nr:TetR/AcrR family transcriptional regulator [Deinococcus misasensis]
MAERFDPAHTLTLLWGTHNRSGRSGLSLKTIVQAALSLADTEGLSSLSMRKVAEQLQVGTMSLYTHVPSKTVLIELMVDTVYAGLYSSPEEATQQPGGWRAGLTFIAFQNWELFKQHPWMLDLSGQRPVLGPHATLKYETELRPLDGIGLTDLEMDTSLQLLLTHTEGSARLSLRQTRAIQDSGLTDLEWWTMQAPLLERVMDSRRFPVASRVGQAAGEIHNAPFNPEHHLQFGLERILDGIESLLAERKTT